MAVYVKTWLRPASSTKDFLGLPSHSPCRRRPAVAVRIVFIKVNDHQYFEISMRKIAARPTQPQFPSIRGCRPDVHLPEIQGHRVVADKAA